MKKLMEDTEILDIFSWCVHRIDVLKMISYCKSFIGFPLKVTKNLSFYRNKHNDLKREMTSSRETGGAADIHKVLSGDNKSLIKIKKNVWTDRILKLSVKSTFIHIAHAIFKGNIDTQKIWVCQRSGKYSQRVDVKYAGHVKQWLASFSEE